MEISNEIVLPGFEAMRKTAKLSDDGRYRYSLTRVWDPGKGLVNWIMLNPSTADARQDDPTIRRCINFTRSWGFGGLVVTNLFALRSPAPEVLELDPDPVGPLNDAAIVHEAITATLHVAAWGVHGRLHGRDQVVRRLLTEHPLRLPLKCLGWTKSGQPRHPLYLLTSASPSPFPAA